MHLSPHVPTILSIVRWTFIPFMAISLFIGKIESSKTPIIPKSNILIDDHWIVFFDNITTPEVFENCRNDVESYNGTVKLLNSFHVQQWVIDEKKLPNILEKYDIYIRFVELDYVQEQKLIYSGSDASNFTNDSEFFNQYGICNKQIRPPKNIDRLDQKELPIDNSYKWSYDGEGVNIYIFDSGVIPHHEEFEGRLHHVYSAFDSIYDCNGHGSHVSGIIGSKTFGVAKHATLHSVKVLDCNGHGTLGDIVNGLMWLKENFQLPAVVQFSLTGAKSASLDDIIKDLYHQGIVIISAAGNDNVDACDISPAGSPYTITVGATDSNDSKASFSNYGDCLDIFAPGTDVPSISCMKEKSFDIKSGTSMSAPHVTGVVAQILEKHPTWKPAQVYLELMRLSSPVVKDSKSANSNLVNSVPSESLCDHIVESSSFKSNLVSITLICLFQFIFM